MRSTKSDQPTPSGSEPREDRISKIMAQRGICSRREADAWLEKGWVKVDGEIASLGQRARSDCRIEISPDARRERSELVSIILNKPIGYVSGQPEPGYEPAVRLITPANQHRSSTREPQLKPQHFDGLAPAGRLDIDSKGLLLFTQDGRIARQVIGEDSEIEKEYLVRVAGEITETKLKQLRFGLELDGQALKPARVERINEAQLKMILQEGKKRQIRRMCELVELKVVGLKRVRIGKLRLGDLPEGRWRFLRPEETI